MAFIPGKFILLAVITLAFTLTVKNVHSIRSVRITHERSTNQHVKSIHRFNGTMGSSQIDSNATITKLDVAFSNVYSISDDFIRATSDLEVLVINGNKKFPPITKQLLSKFPKLNFVKIHNNDGLIIEQDAFTDLKDLKILILNNQDYKHIIKDIFKGLNLKALSIVDSKVEEIDSDAFSTLPDLEQLYLSYNKLSAIKPGTFEGLNKLKDLWLHVNKLENIDWGSFPELPSLKFLDLADNKLTTIDATKMVRLFPKLHKIHLPSGLIGVKDQKEILVNAGVIVAIRDYF